MLQKNNTVTMSSLSNDDAENQNKLNNFNKAYEQGSTELNHRYLKEQKYFINRKVLVDSGVRLLRDPNDNAYLYYPLRTFDSDKPVQFQAIYDVPNAKGQFNKAFHCSANGKPVFSVIGGNENYNPSDVEIIVLAESLTKATAIYQALEPEGQYYACVLNCISLQNMAKVATFLGGIDDYKSKVVVCADNDSADTSLIIDKVVSDKGLRICRPRDGFKDFDDFYNCNIHAPSEINDLIKGAKTRVTGLNHTAYKLHNAFDGWNDEEDMLIDGLLPKNSFGLLFGLPGSYKSFLAIAIACCISEGKKFNAEFVEQADVLYISAEGNGAIGRRFKAWAEYNGIQSLDRLKTIRQPVPLTSAEAVTEFISFIKAEINKSKLNFGAIIVDTLSRCFGGEDENATKAMCAFIAGCDELKAEFGATVIVVHHKGKTDKKVARGNSALFGAVDFEYYVKRPDPETRNEVVLECTKMKDGDPPEPTLFKLESVSMGLTKRGKARTSLYFDDDGIPYKEESVQSVLDECEQIMIELVSQEEEGKKSQEFNDDFYHAMCPEINKFDKPERDKLKTKFRQRKKRAIEKLIDKGLIIQDREGVINLSGCS
ncbi:AAA family ATPase [Thalassotalea aquiviva]|uniref:AAA family ATPase n=1 Tax=Thalassotalea aquiviva TaxID=3242415 RepID=UPI00352AE477